MNAVALVGQESRLSIQACVDSGQLKRQTIAEFVTQKACRHGGSSDL